MFSFHPLQQFNTADTNIYNKTSNCSLQARKVPQAWKWLAH